MKVFAQPFSKGWESRSVSGFNDVFERVFNNEACLIPLDICAGNAGEAEIIALENGFERFANLGGRGLYGDLVARFFKRCRESVDAVVCRRAELIECCLTVFFNIFLYEFAGRALGGLGIEV